MEAASLINVRADEEERIDGEDEETPGEKENCQSQDQAIVKESHQATGEKTDRDQVQSCSQEGRRSFGSAQARGRQESRIRRGNEEAISRQGRPGDAQGARVG